MEGAPLDAVKAAILQRQLRGLRIYGRTVEEHESYIWSSIDAEQAKSLRDFLATTPLPTAAQNPFLYRTLFKLEEECKKAGAALGLSLPTAPVLATEHAGELNGFAFSFDGAHHGIVLDEYLFVFAYLLSKVIVQLFTDENPDGTGTFTFERDNWAEHIMSRTAATSRLAEMLVSYLSTGNASSAPTYAISTMGTLVAEQITAGAELFAVAHEFGHVFHGHLSPTQPKSEPDGTIESTAPHYRRTVDAFAREFQADLYALKIVLAANNGKSEIARLMGTLGVFAFFVAIDLLERMVIYAKQGIDLAFEDELYRGYLFKYEAETMSHPPPQLRRALLLGWIKLNLPAYHEQCDRMDGALYRMLNGAFLIARTRIDNELQAGMVIHPRWDTAVVDLEALRARGRATLGAKQE